MVADHTLRQMHEDGSRAWPDVDVAQAAYHEWIEARAGDGFDPKKFFAADLYLACACAGGDETAMAAFERTYFGEVGRALKRFRAPDVQRADLEQTLREKFFVAGKIAQYTGRGPLRLWVRVSVARTLHNLAVRGPKETPLEDALVQDLEAAPMDPELRHMKELYRAEFREAFATAISRLDVGDRLLLHQRFAQQISQADLARGYEVHVNTIARWTKRARTGLESELRGALAARLELGVDELGSVLALVRSRLDVSLGALV